MHIPDGFLDAKTAGVTAGLSIAGVTLALRRVKHDLPPRKIPLLGLAAAFLFAAQMVNFPVAGGTSGHLVGGVLAAALLGPSAAVVVVTTVLIVQCFLFADGGVLALGGNIFNMAILNSFGGYAVYRLVCRFLPGERGRLTAMAFAGWCAAVLASIACAGELAWSGTVGWSVGFPAMATVHMLIGIGEGIISALVLLAVRQTRPDLISENASAATTVRKGEWFGYGLLLVLGIAIFIAPFACPWPDGLDAVAAKFGFEHKAVAGLSAAPAAGYQIPGIHWAVGATAMAGGIGTLVVFGLALLLGKILVRKKSLDA